MIDDTADTNRVRSQSFGSAAGDYERFRTGPPENLVEWMLPAHVGTVVDLGAGTGALTRMLIDRADVVVAVEPDERMRRELTANVPAAQAMEGRGEHIPLPDAAADAVLASSSWHWMDLVPTLHEVGRVLVPGGWLGTVWSGPDPEGALFAQAKVLLSQEGSGGGQAASSTDAQLGEEEFSSLILGDGNRPEIGLEIPDGVPFEQPEYRVHTWEVPLNADQLVGLLGTLSWVLTMEEDARNRVFSETRRILKELLGIEGEVTVDVEYKAEAWRARRVS